MAGFSGTRACSSGSADLGGLSLRRSAGHLLSDKGPGLLFLLGFESPVDKRRERTEVTSLDVYMAEMHLGAVDAQQTISLILHTIGRN